MTERATQDERVGRKLQLLMEANLAILGQLSLASVLRQITASACELAGARYAALGVLGADGELAQLIHVGMGEDVVRRIGGLPRGLGLLGVLIDDPRPVRLERISDDPRSSGFPQHHPAMETFLGVPIKVRDVVYGNLYLTERVGGGVFTAEDQTTIGVFGVTAGIAIENARLYEKSRRSQYWAEAVAEVGSALLDPSGDIDPLGLIAETVLRLTEADLVSFVVPGIEPNTFRVQLARGPKASEIEGLVYPASRSVAAFALETGRGVRISAYGQEHGFVVYLREVVDIGAVLALPLSGSTGSHGVLIVGRGQGRPGFSVDDLEAGEAFGAQAAVAIELGQARARAQLLVVVEDRQRIARDLHDHVIQRIFVAGLTLERLAGSLDPAAASRLVSVVDDLDVTIRQIRTVIFRLEAPANARSLRSAVVQVVDEARPGLGFEPDLRFDGPVDTVVGEAVVDQVVAVTREALSNVVRHAHASRVTLQVAVGADLLSVVVTDNGIGLHDVSRRSGLRNLEQRALSHDGVCELGVGPVGGTVLRWSIPLR